MERPFKRQGLYKFLESPLHGLPPGSSLHFPVTATDTATVTATTTTHIVTIMITFRLDTAVATFRPDKQSILHASMSDSAYTCVFVGGMKTIYVSDTGELIGEFQAFLVCSMDMAGKLGN